MIRLRSVLAVGVAYIGALFIFAPATLIDATLVAGTGGALRLSRAQGTLWQGGGYVEVALPPPGVPLSQPLRWAIHSSDLLYGRLTYEITDDRANRLGRATVSLLGLELRDVVLRLPVEIAHALAPRLAALQLTGLLDLRIERAMWSTQGLNGTARVEWPDAGSRLTRVPRIGSYQFRLAARDGAGELSVQSSRGPLEVDGVGLWNDGAIRSFKGRLRVVEQREQLLPLVRLVAREQSDGQFDITW